MDKSRWHRHTIAVPIVSRLIDCYKKDTKGDVHRYQYSEMVHQHDVYRKVLNGKPTSQLWHRGAKVQ